MNSGDMKHRTKRTHTACGDDGERFCYVFTRGIFFSGMKQTAPEKKAARE